MVAFIGGIHVGSVRRGTRGLVCRSEERNDEESVSSSEGEPLLSRREAREKAAKEREDRIRKRREERRKRLDVMDGLVTPEEAAELEEEVKVMPDGNYGENASGVFGWVNQNPSSKNAVYMQPFKGDGGNTGEMAQKIRGRGRTGEGSEVKIQSAKGELNIYVRKVGSEKNNLAPIVLVHGVLANSWSYKELLDEFQKNDREAYAFDFPGTGYSSWPQPGVGFQFSEEALMDVVGKTLDIIGLANREVILVTQGYVTSQYGNLWALANPNRIEKLVLLNQPLLPTSKIPFILQQYRIPLVAPFVSQDAMRAERFLEGGGPYVMPVSDSERYREAYLESMMPGLALKDCISRINFESVMKREFEGMKKIQDKIIVIWGTSDKYISEGEADEFVKATRAKIVKIDNAGFMVQADWPPRVGDAIRAL